MLLTPYILFNGNCREAMLFYQACLGGDLTFQTVADAPEKYEWPVDMTNIIMQATLTKDSFTLKASDLIQEDTLVKGNAVTLMLKCTDYEEAKNVMTRLLVGGTTIQGPGTSQDNSWLTSLMDKYGHYWTIFWQANGD